MIGLAVDIGTAVTKVGFIGESSPRMVTESFLLEGQRAHQEEDMFGRQREERIFGNTVNIWRYDVTAQWVFKEEWQDQQQLRLHSVALQREPFGRFLSEVVREMRELKEKHNSMNEQSSQYGLLVVEPVYLKKHEVAKWRETICAVIFDELRLAAVHFLKSSVAVAFSQGRSNAIVIDSGHNFTTISRVIDGYPEKTVTLNFAGNILSHSLQNTLNKKGVTQHTSFFQKKGRCEVFESLCKYKELTTLKANFAVQNNAEVQAADVILELADKATITVGRSEIVEPFSRVQEFRQVSDISLPLRYFGVVRIVADLLQEQNYNNFIDTVILTGGNMQFSDLALRLSDQLTRTLDNRHLGQKKIVRSQHPLLSSWIGGSVAASTEVFQNYWCNANDYREQGVSLVDKKCPL